MTSKGIAVRYHRVSTDPQAENVSLENQSDLTLKLSWSEGYEDRKEYVLDEVGLSIDPDRFGLIWLRSAIKDPDVKAVIAYDPTRIARDPLLMMIVSRDCEEAGVDLLFVHGPSGNTAEDQLMRVILGYVGGKERERFRRASMETKLKVAAEQQRIPVGTDTYGYDYDKVTKSRRVNKQEAAVVRRLFKLAASGWTLYAMAVLLNDEGIPSKHGKLWHPLTIKRLLQNTSYIGIDVYNKIRSETIGTRKYRRTLRPESEWVYIRGFSEPIVDLALFAEVQYRLRMPRAVDRSYKDRYLLTGFTCCPTCGTPVCGGSRAKGVRRYRCRGTTKTDSGRPKICSEKYILADEFEESVWEHVCAALRNPDNVISDLLQYVETGAGDIGDEIARLKREIDRCSREESRLMRLSGHEGIDDDLLFKQIVPVNALRKEHEERVLELERQQTLVDEVGEVRARLMEYCRRLAEGLDDLDFDGKRETLAAFGVRVEAVKEDWSITASVNLPVTTIERTLA